VTFLGIVPSSIALSKAALFPRGHRHRKCVRRISTRRYWLRDIADKGDSAHLTGHRQPNAPVNRFDNYRSKCGSAKHEKRIRRRGLASRQRGQPPNSDERQQHPGQQCRSAETEPLRRATSSSGDYFSKFSMAPLMTFPTKSSQVVKPIRATITQRDHMVNIQPDNTATVTTMIAVPSQRRFPKFGPIYRIAGQCSI
jgi:hypothetical protein